MMPTDPSHRPRNLGAQLPRPIGFVLGGGGSLGAAQVGMLEALVECGLYADLVAGTSIGAINGALVAADPVGAAHRLSHLWRGLEINQIMPTSVIRRLRALIRPGGTLYESPRISDLVRREVGVTDISELAIPYLAMAMDADTTEPVVLDSGPLLTAMLASSAIPGVFPVVNRDGRNLYDGGLVVNAPILQALGQGARSLVVLDCSFPGQPIARPTNLREAVMYSLMIQLRQQVARDLPVAAREVPVLSLPGPRPLAVSPLDFTSALPLIAVSYRAARQFLARVALEGPGLYEADRTGAG